MPTEPVSRGPFDVFLSYARADNHTAEHFSGPRKQLRDPSLILLRLGLPLRLFLSAVATAGIPRAYD